MFPACRCRWTFPLGIELVALTVASLSVLVAAAGRGDGGVFDGWDEYILAMVSGLMVPGAAGAESCFLDLQKLDIRYGLHLTTCPRAYADNPRRPSPTPNKYPDTGHLASSSPHHPRTLALAYLCVTRLARSASPLTYPAANFGTQSFSCSCLCISCPHHPAHITSQRPWLMSVCPRSRAQGRYCG